MSTSTDRTYTDICIPPNTIHFEFPAEAVGGIKPGSINWLSELPYTINIKWGLNMTQPIEPGTIPSDFVCLMLDESYKHPIDDSMIPDSVPLYIHDSNRDTGPKHRDFWLWRRNKPFTRKEFESSDLIAQLSPCESGNYSFLPGAPIYIISVKHKPDSQQPASVSIIDLSDLKAPIVEL